MNLLVLDVDDTILVDRFTKVKRKLPTDAKEVLLSTKEYSKEVITPDTVKYYDFSLFDDPEHIYHGIMNSMILLDNLKTMDLFINNGFKLAILTARGREDIIIEALKDFLKYKNYSTGDLEEVTLDYIFAVGDSKYSYLGSTTSIRKAEILKMLSEKYNKIIFMDDDEKNISKVNDLNLHNVIALKVQ